MAALLAFRRSRSGATAIEYGLIAALIGGGIITGLTATGVSVEDQWGGLKDAVVNAITPKT